MRCLMPFTLIIWLTCALADKPLLSREALHQLVEMGARVYAKDALLRLYEVSGSIRDEIQWLDTEVRNNFLDVAVGPRWGREMEVSFRRSLISTQHHNQRPQASMTIPGVLGTFKVSAHTLSNRSPFKVLESDFEMLGDDSILHWVMVCKEARIPGSIPSCGLLGLLKSPFRLTRRGLSMRLRHT